MSETLTTCGYCGCGCGLILTEENGKVASAKPPRNHVVAQGKICAKGWHGFNFVHNKDRLKSPLIKENGVFREATYKEAYEKIKEGFNKIMADGDNTEHIGVLASARCTNEENFLTSKLGRAALRTATIDHCARL